MPSILQLEKLLAAEPGDAFILYALAQEHTKLGQYERAIEYYNRCIASDANHAYAYYHKARVLMTSGHPDAARETIHAGMQAAVRTGDAHARGELAALLESTNH